MLTAFDLDLDTLLALRIRRGGENLHRVVPSLVRELLAHRRDCLGLLRLFLDCEAYKAALSRDIKANPQVRFYCAAVRFRSLVAQWERLHDQGFEPELFFRR